MFKKFSLSMLLTLLALSSFGCGEDDPASGDDGAAGDNSGGGGTSGGTTGGTGGTGDTGGTAGTDTGGTAGTDTGGTGGNGDTGGTGGTGTLTVAAVDDCLGGGTDVNYCSGTPKPYYWECNTNPDDTPPATGCEHPADIPSPDARWCCPEPFCSTYHGFDCSMVDSTLTHTYICSTDTPGIDSCTPFVSNIQCCP
jgi:hypothetical protein